MLQPVRTKYRKAFKGRIHGNASRAVKLNYGQFGLKAIQPDRIIGVKVWIYKGEVMAKDVEREKKERVKNATASQD